MLTDEELAELTRSRTMKMTADERAELNEIARAFMPSRGMSLWCKLLMDLVDDERELAHLRSRVPAAGEIAAIGVLYEHVEDCRLSIADDVAAAHTVSGLLNLLAPSERTGRL